MTELPTGNGEALPANDEKQFDPSALPEGMVFQISMRTLLLLVAALALLIAAVFAFPPVLSAVLATLAALCVPAVLITCVIYGPSKWQAFAIGMLVPSLWRIFGSGWTGSLAIASLASRNWQSYPGMAGPSGSAPADSGDYFRLLFEYWNQTGHALMADETLFWVASSVAGFSALIVQKQFARSPHLQPRSGESA